MRTSQRFGPWLARQLVEREMTQRDLGTAIGVSQQAVSCWVRETSIPSARLVQAISVALGVELAELYAVLDASWR